MPWPKRRLLTQSRVSLAAPGKTYCLHNMAADDCHTQTQDLCSIALRRLHIGSYVVDALDLCHTYVGHCCHALEMFWRAATAVCTCKGDFFSLTIPFNEVTTYQATAYDTAEAQWRYGHLSHRCCVLPGLA